MESLYYRYRNITVLLVSIIGQLILLAWQIKSENDVPLVRVWAITAITPVASLIENARNGTTGFFGSYFALRDAREQSRRLRTETDKLRIENQLLRNELAAAQRTEGLLGFQSRTPSRMLGARVIGTTTGAGTRSLLIDRGNASGVRKGMAVVTPSGIIGKILAVYPFASQVLTISDPGFAAGVESQRVHAKGVLRGLGNGQVRVDYIPAGVKMEPGELFFTSGEDRVFPKGLPAAKLISAKESPTFQEVYVEPSGNESAPEEVLVIVDPVHQEIPNAPPPDSPVFLAPDVPANMTLSAGAPAGTDPTAPAVPPSGNHQPTQADKIMEQYRKIGEAQKFTFGEGGPGSAPPNFNIRVPAPGSGASGATGTTGKPGPSGATGGTGSIVRPGQPGVTGAFPLKTPSTGPAAGTGAAVKPPTAPTGSAAGTGGIAKPPAIPGAALPPVA
ncbi:MAG TPA: rod shape-determining protein MreC, partial [Bryobacteraceae bacterium]|nr:rod shape-determining protein MreC [Bryobacteraceae bacterium]